MRILIADDEVVSRTVLQSSLEAWGHDVTVCEDGAQAWETLSGSDDPPKVAVLDWQMPALEGPDICERVRASESLAGTYIIMLTSRNRRADLLRALEAGADDYLVKPFDPAEMQTRLRVAQRVSELQCNLNARVAELQEALATVKRLGSLLPICCYCKKIRNDQNYWQQVEEYFGEQVDTEFTHGICPDCLTTILQ